MNKAVEMAPDNPRIRVTPTTSIHTRSLHDPNPATSNGPLKRNATGM